MKEYYLSMVHMVQNSSNSGITKGSAPVELLNITNPDAVVQLQDEYVKAGVDFLLTNTFSANRHKHTQV